MNTLAKRIHNITPDPIRITFSDETTVVLRMNSAEFFQESFQGEGMSDNDERYRIVTEGENDDTVIAGKQADDSWSVVGTIVDVTPADSDRNSNQ